MVSFNHKIIFVHQHSLYIAHSIISILLTEYCGREYVFTIQPSFLPTSLQVSLFLMVLIFKSYNPRFWLPRESSLISWGPLRGLLFLTIFCPFHLCTKTSLCFLANPLSLFRNSHFSAKPNLGFSPRFIFSWFFPWVWCFSLNFLGLFHPEIY